MPARLLSPPASPPSSATLPSLVGPQDVCKFMTGLGLLRHAPPAPVLRVLLAHLGAEVPRPEAAPDAATGAYPQLTGDLSHAATADVCASGTASAATRQRGTAAGGAPAGGSGIPTQLVLERYSSQELADLVHALRRMLTGRADSSGGGGGVAAAGGGGAPGVPAGYSERELPTAVGEAFFDALDTVRGSGVRDRSTLCFCMHLPASTPRRTACKLLPHHPRPSSPCRSCACAPPSPPACRRVPAATWH